MFAYDISEMDTMSMDRGKLNYDIKILYVFIGFS